MPQSQTLQKRVRGCTLTDEAWWNSVSNLSQLCLSYVTHCSSPASGSWLSCGCRSHAALWTSLSDGLQPLSGPTRCTLWVKKKRVNNDEKVMLTSLCEWEISTNASNLVEILCHAYKNNGMTTNWGKPAVAYVPFFSAELCSGWEGQGHMPEHFTAIFFPVMHAW